MEDSARHAPRQSNLLNHLVESHVGTSRNAIKFDLIDKIVYDDLPVLKRLRIDQVDDNFVTTCATSLEAEYMDDIILLKILAEQASKKAPEVLEFEEVNDKASDPNTEQKSGNHGSVEEKKMYDPLVRLFRHIANFGESAKPRIFQRTNGMLKADEPHTFGFPSCSPDITISSYGIEASKSKLWRHRDAFGEVKPSNRQRPKPTTPGTIPEIVTQSADYARLLMSARPFMLFCVGILISGTEFCVGIFDRDGVTFSPAYDMFEDTEVLVRVVHSLACSLSIEELGSDPTARVLSVSETLALTSNTETYSSAVLASGGSDFRKWCTIGPPIWSSLSLLGRGTNVWRVRQYVEKIDQPPFLQGDIMIMKTEWRSSARTPESEIYLSIDQPPEGLAKFECGGDVQFAGYPITVQNLRTHPIYDFLPQGDILPTPVLHRLILSTVGRPMWEYTSEIDLLMGFRDALQAHRDLCNRGILHRDVSAGNILLAEHQSALLRGFIADLEFARIESSTLTKPPVTVTSIVGPQRKYDDQGRVISITEETTRTHTRFGSTVKVQRGSPMTGTAQFMAGQLLRRRINEYIIHQPKHDVESFIWVLSYCVMRNLYRRTFERSALREVSDQRAMFRTLFRQAFGQQTVRSIAIARQSMSDALIFTTEPDVQNIVENFMSQALISLFGDLQVLIHGASSPRDPIPLTHDALLTAVNNTILLL